MKIVIKKTYCTKTGGIAIKQLQAGDRQLLNWRCGFSLDEVCFHLEKLYLTRYESLQKTCADPFKCHKKHVTSKFREYQPTFHHNLNCACFFFFVCFFKACLLHEKIDCVHVWTIHVLKFSHAGTFHFQSPSEPLMRKLQPKFLKPGQKVCSNCYIHCMEQDSDLAFSSSDTESHSTEFDHKSLNNITKSLDCTPLKASISKRDSTSYGKRKIKIQPYMKCDAFLFL